MSTHPYHTARKEMLERHLAARDIRDERVLAAMAAVPREEFVEGADRAQAYADRALQIGHGQTISQPYVVAYTLEAARVRPGDRLLDVGTGTGYAAAVAAELTAEVDSIECVPELAASARARLARLESPVRVHVGDGARGLPEGAPFDVIVAAAAAPHIPEAWWEQLAPGGRIVAPIDDLEDPRRDGHVLVRGTVRDGQRHVERLLPVRFVPLVSG